MISHLLPTCFPSRAAELHALNSGEGGSSATECTRAVLQPPCTAAATVWQLSWLEAMGSHLLPLSTSRSAALPALSSGEEDHKQHSASGPCCNPLEQWLQLRSHCCGSKQRAATCFPSLQAGWLYSLHWPVGREDHSCYNTFSAAYTREDHTVITSGGWLFPQRGPPATAVHGGEHIRWAASKFYQQYMLDFY